MKSEILFKKESTEGVNMVLREAKARGAKTVNGLGMLVEQGALNFKLWTGVDAPVELMTEVLRKEFNL